MEERETTKELAEEAFRMSASMLRSVAASGGNPDWKAEDSINIMLGQNILREETGFYGSWDGVRYSFDEQTRDRLLAHGRQDTATASVMARSAFREACNAKRLGERIMILVAVSLLLNAAVLASLWL